MSTELSKPITVVDPTTGEQLTLDAPTGDLALFIADVREYESLLREAKKLVSQELLSRMDANASWTINEGGLTIKGASPAPIEEFDAEALRHDLLLLADDGLITLVAISEAVEPVVTYKAHRKGINALRKLGGRVADTIEKHRHEIEKNRYLTVTRS